MVGITSSLTSLSRITGANVNPELINVDSIIQENIDNLSGLAESNHVEVYYESSLPTHTIQCDPYLISEILKQIIMNGLLFRDTQAKGHLRISSNVNHDQFVIIIEDDGDGIDPSIHGQIFEMFFRGSEKSGGIGLGLYIVKKAVELLQGDITFVSTTQGTSFEIQIPTIFTASSTEEAF
jgi:signal transduction histidine kinase